MAGRQVPGNRNGQEKLYGLRIYKKLVFQIDCSFINRSIKYINLKIFIIQNLIYLMNFIFHSSKDILFQEMVYTTKRDKIKSICFVITIKMIFGFIKWKKERKSFRI